MNSHSEQPIFTPNNGPARVLLTLTYLKAMQSVTHPALEETVVKRAAALLRGKA